jgi:hypothetical protein
MEQDGREEGSRPKKTNAASRLFQKFNLAQRLRQTLGRRRGQRTDDSGVVEEGGSRFEIVAPPSTVAAQGAAGQRDVPRQGLTDSPEPMEPGREPTGPSGQAPPGTSGRARTESSGRRPTGSSGQESTGSLGRVLRTAKSMGELRRKPPPPEYRDVVPARERDNSAPESSRRGGVEEWTISEAESSAADALGDQRLRRFESNPRFQTQIAITGAVQSINQDLQNANRQLLPLPTMRMIRDWRQGEGLSGYGFDLQDGHGVIYSGGEYVVLSREHLQQVSFTRGPRAVVTNRTFPAEPTRSRTKSR